MKSMRMTWATFTTLGLLACGGDGEPGPAGAAGPAGQTGATGPEGPTSSSSGTVGTPSISGISPAEIFLGYPTVLTISGSGTHWMEAPAVTFEGEGGVVVDSVELASPTALVVTVHAERTASIGPRTVRVGTESFAGFTVSPDLSIEYLGDEPLRAGGTAIGLLTGRNPLNPFLPAYATTFTPSFSQNGTAVVPGEVLSLSLGSPSATGTLIAVGINADVAALGTYDFDMVGPYAGAQVAASRFTGTQLVKVAAAEPIVVPAFPTTVTFTGDSMVSSRLLQNQAATAGRLSCLATAATPTDGRNVLLKTLGTTGRFGDESVHVKAGETISMSLQLLRVVPGSSTENVTVTCSIAASSVIDEVEPNETTANPLALGQAVHGSIAAPTDVDVYSVTSVGFAWRIKVARRQASTQLSVRLKRFDGTEVGTFPLDADGTSESIQTLPAGTGTIEVFAAPASLPTPAQRGGDYELMFEIYN